MTIPIKKHPIKLTNIIQPGSAKKVEFFIKSLIRYLNVAPKAPPNAMRINFVIMV